MNDQAIKPGRGWYTLATVIFLAGLACGAVGIYATMQEMIKALEPTRHASALVPGATDPKLSEPGRYTVFVKLTRAGDLGESGEDLSVKNLQYTLSQKGSMVQIPIRLLSYIVTYHFNDRQGRGVFEFEIDQPGDYAFSASSPEGKASPEHTLLFMLNPLSEKLLAISLGSTLAALVATCVAAIIAIVTFAKRHKAKSLLLASLLAK